MSFGLGDLLDVLESSRFEHSGTLSGRILLQVAPSDDIVEAARNVVRSRKSIWYVTNVEIARLERASVRELLFDRVVLSYMLRRAFSSSSHIKGGLTKFYHN